MFGRLLSLLVLVIAASSHAAVEDTDVVPTSISMTEYCGFTSVDPIVLNDIPAGVPANDVAVTFDVSYDCPAGWVRLWFDGDATGYDIGGGAKLFIRASLSNTEHRHVGFKVSSWYFGGAVGSRTLYAVIVDAADTTVTPSTKISWSGIVPLTLEHEP